VGWISGWMTWACTHTVDIGGELAELDADSYRPPQLPARG
jgi:hypothetical protein